MRKRRAVEHLSQQSPMRQASVHHSAKPIIVFAHEQVRHFMHDDVFEALAGLRCEIGVEPDAATAGIAAPPLRFQPMHEEARNPYAHLAWRFSQLHPDSNGSSRR